MLGCSARRHRPRREPRERALEGHRAHDAQRHRRDRGPPLLGARRARLARHRARRAQQRAGGRDHAGRLDAHAAAREEPLPAARGQQPLDQQEDRRGLDRRAAAGQVHEGRDPHGLSQHGLLRPERLRRRGRGAHVLRQAGEAAHAAAVGPAGRPAAGAHRLQPVPPPGRRARAPQRGAAGDALAALDQRGRLRARRATPRSASSAAATAPRSPRPFVFEQVRQELGAKLPAKLAARGGYRVYSTVDQRLQFAARRAIKDVLKSPGDPQAALVAINVHNGNVLALGTSDYFSATNQFNLATVGHRSPGSTFKLFALVDALRRGADPTKVFYPSGYVSFPENDPVCPQAGGWSPQQRRERLRRLHEPRDRDDPLGQRRLRATHARSRAGAGGRHRAPARHPLEAPAALLDGARRRRRDAARADERLRHDRRRRRSTTPRA